MTKRETTAAQGLELAIETLGGPGKLARALGIGAAAISQWRSRKGIPAERIPDVARVTGLSAETLRPDLFYAHAAPQGRKAKKVFVSYNANDDDLNSVYVAISKPLAEVVHLGLDPAKILQEALSNERARQWQMRNQSAIAERNRMIEEEGLPYAANHELP